MKHLLKKVCAVVLSVTMIAGMIANANRYCVKAATVLTSPDISVVGFQMKTNVSEQEGISFRAMCKAPSVGSTITVNGTNYTVTALGTIYSKDPNQTGKNEHNVLDKSYTELNPVPYFDEDIRREYGFKYIGMKTYQETVITFGYIATQQGILEQTAGYTTYVRTMTGMENYLLNTLRVRAFVEATNAEGDNVIIYGQYSTLISVAEIAYKVYTKGEANNKEGHNYLYDTILSRLPETNSFYIDTPIEYGWGGGVVNP